MKIVYVVTRADEVGGAQIHVRDLATALRGAGADVTVLAGAWGPLSDQLDQQGVPFRAVPSLVRPIRPLRDLVALRELKAALRQLEPDLVSTHSSKAGALGRLAARSLGIPALFTAHGWAFTEGVGATKGRLFAATERALAPLAAHIITVSEYDRSLAIAHRIAPPDRVTRIHNGIVDRFGGAPARPLGGPARIVMVGRFVEQKDHATLVRALSRLGHLAWRLELVGSGPGEGAARALTEELDIAAHVDFLGERRDVHPILAGADVYVLTTNWEGLPRSILEAMSAGLPVVATRVGGVPEAVIEGETGYLVPRANPEATALALGHLIENPDLRRALGTAGRRHYETEFRFDIMYDRTLEIYRSVTARRRAIGVTDDPKAQLMPAERELRGSHSGSPPPPSRPT